MLRVVQMLQVMSEKMEPLPEVRRAGAYVSIRQRMLTYAPAQMEPLPEVRRAGAYVSIRQHTSVYVSIRQHTSAMQPEVRRAGEALRWGRRSMCVLILLYMCPHTAIYVSSYCYMCPHTPHTAIYVSACCYIYGSGGAGAQQETAADAQI